MDIHRKIGELIALGSALLEFSESLSSKYADLLTAAGRTMNQRERFSLALFAKISNSFSAILHDAKEDRPEAMHHLKPLIECYIFMGWIYNKKANDADRRARFVEARGLKETVKFFKANKPAFDGYAVSWGSGLIVLPKGRKMNLRHFIKGICGV